MQTLCAGNRRAPQLLLRRIATAATVMALMTATACTTPRLEGRDEAERAVSPCESAITSAMAADTIIASGIPILMTYDATLEARDAWLDTAVQCPARFGEGVMRAARMAVTAQRLGETFDGADTDPGWSTSGITSLDSATHQSALNELVDVADAALAEDKAGFALEVLAAQGVEGASLQSSDSHKAAAQMLASIGDDDPRQGVYDVTALLAHPTNATDNSTGLRAPTSAIVQMDAARALIDAAATRSDNAASTDDTTTIDRDIIDEAWRAYAIQAADNARQAFLAGFPMTDEAIFTSPDN